MTRPPSRWPLPIGHIFDPSLSTRPGEPERCVCGRPKDHVFHRHILKHKAAA